MGYSGFIVRPFGKRAVTLADGTALTVDFEAIERDLIRPALQRCGVAGATTQAVVAAGNIREDMFQLLAHADVVVADVSLHNANVFYELGARHALRERRTYLIRFNTGDAVPFDIATDRYLVYDPRRPELAVDNLAAGLAATLADRTRIDSPIFRLLPSLRVPKLAELMPVPAGFADELRSARHAGGVGHLVLLGEEAAELPWGAEGLRLVGRALGELGCNAAAVQAWEALRTRVDHDVEADLKLAALYVREDKLAASDLAIERVLAAADADRDQRAEALALRGRNAKLRWQQSWRDTPAGAERQRQALQSTQLVDAIGGYAAAFEHDLNHYYSGVNALLLAQLRLALAAALPQDWCDAHEDDAVADTELRRLRGQVSDLLGAVKLSLQGAAARRPAGSGGEPDWARASMATVRLLRHERAGQVVSAYRRALEGQPPAVFDSLVREWELLAALGLYPELLALLKPLLDRLEPANPDAASPAGPQRVLLFTGHRIDSADRATPRFPAQHAERVLADLTAELRRVHDGFAPGTRVLAICGGASGGDILFHEACHALGIACHLYLPMAAQDFVRLSVEAGDGRSDWVPRFHAISQRCRAGDQLRELGSAVELPGWLRERPNYTIWERNNRWMLHSALAHGADKLTLFALWDGQSGDGPGGTQHMVNVVKKAGAEWRHIALPIDGSAPQ